MTARRWQKGQTGRQVYARLTKSVGFKPGDFVAVKVEEPTLNWVVKITVQPRLMQVTTFNFWSRGTVWKKLKLD